MIPCIDDRVLKVAANLRRRRGVAFVPSGRRGVEGSWRKEGGGAWGEAVHFHASFTMKRCSIEYAATQGTGGGRGGRVEGGEGRRCAASHCSALERALSKQLRRSAALRRGGGGGGGGGGRERNLYVGEKERKKETNRGTPRSGGGDQEREGTRLKQTPWGGCKRCFGNNRTLMVP